MNWVVWLGTSSGLAVWFIFDSLQRRIDHFDSVYLKKWLMNKPNPIDAGLQDFFTKIVIKWVIRFCIAAESCLYHWPSMCWGNKLSVWHVHTPHMHAYIACTSRHRHTYITYTHTNICIHVHAHIHACTRAHAHTQMHTLIIVIMKFYSTRTSNLKIELSALYKIQIHMHTYSCMHTHIHMCTHWHTHRMLLPCERWFKYIDLTPKVTCMQAHTHTHTHACTHTNTHRHTRTRMHASMQVCCLNCF